MQVGSSADAATCAQTTRSSFRPFKDKRPRHEIRSVSEPPSAAAAGGRVSRNERLFSRWRNCRRCCGRPISSWRGRWRTNRIWKIPFKQPTKKLLQRFQTFSFFVHIYCLTTFLADSYIPGFSHSLPIRISPQLKNCNIFHFMLLEFKQILGRPWLPLLPGGYEGGWVWGCTLQLSTVENEKIQEVSCLLGFLLWVRLLSLHHLKTRSST